MRNLIPCAIAAALFAGCSKSGSGHTMIQNKGSDTMVNVAQAWAEEYRKVRPETAVAVSGGGSGTGIASLVNGTVDIASSSREIKPAEKELAKKNTGKDAVEHDTYEADEDDRREDALEAEGVPAIPDEEADAGTA